MKIICYLYILLLANNALASKYTDVGLPIITNFTQNEYKAHNQNWDIVQADNQLIYVANGNGLLEYDGETWAKYNTPNRSRIRDIEIIGSKIFVGTVNDLGYFAANKKGVLQYNSLNMYIDKQYLPYGEVFSVIAFNDKVVFKTADYFFIWDGQSIRTVKDKSSSRVKITSLNQTAYVKLYGDASVYTLDLGKQDLLVKTNWQLPVNAQIRAVHKDDDKQLVFFTGKNGIFKQDGNLLKKLTTPFKEGTFVYDVVKSPEGWYYVATVNQGFYVLSSELLAVKNYRDFHGLGMNAITAVMSDQQNNIWLVGNTAISVMRPPHQISRYAKSESVYGFNLTLIQNKLSFLGQGVLQLQSNSINPLYPPIFEKVDNSELAEFDVWESLDFDKNTFLGKNNGVDLVTINNDKIELVQAIIDEPIFAFDVVATDDFKHVFTASNNGLYHSQLLDTKWHSEIVKGVESEVNDLSIEDNKILWVGSSSAQLYRLNIENINTSKSYLTIFDKNDGIGNNKVVPFNLSMGTVFATNDGVMQYHQKQTRPLQFIKNMPKIFTTQDQDAHLLYEDSENRLWYRIGTHSGFATKSATQEWNINEFVFDYFPRRSINSFVSMSQNIMWFLQAGDNIFRMNVVETQKIPPIAPLYIRQVTDLNINTNIKSGIVIELNGVLDYDANSIRISYALADYTIPNKALYRSRLIGLQNSQWSDWSEETYKDFTTLRGNDYTLEVQAKDGFGRQTASTTLKFTVLPPFYLSQLALFVYALAAITLLVVTAWIVQKWRTKKLQIHNVQLADLVNKKTIEIQGHVQELQQQQELKTRFFTNISHELRTPLSLIILPLQKLIKYNKQTLNNESQELLTLSLKNANGMKQLVNQVLDVSRFEDKVMPIAVQNNNLPEFVEIVSRKFISWAQENQQQIIVFPPIAKIELFFDTQMMEKIVSNLISNAIKYSGQGTIIKVSFFADETSAGFIIKDNGIGIAKAQCQEVFERYFKSTEPQDEHDSSGIGLDFVKEMVDLHHANIELISDTGRGCEFKLTFKLGKQHFSTVIIENEINPTKQSIDFEHPEDTPVVLIVEDNHDLRKFISQSLSLEYRVIQAINGADAMQTLKHELPDLIISDIMMPQMDGIEFLQKLRAQNQFKTTPFILLSSKSTQNDTQVGLQYGANDYITKPFDMDELLLRVRNMVNSRRLIRQEVQQQLQEIKQEIKHQPSAKRSDFEKKIREIIIDNISDSQFNVSSLAAIICIERTTLFRKVKKEIGISPSKYIQMVRLETAKKLLENNSLSVSEVAYASGFESLSYFSKIFKHIYGKPPSALANQASF